MKVFEKKIIVAPTEFKETQMGTLFSKMGFSFSSSIDDKEIENYFFVIDDYLPEVKNLPRLATKAGSSLDLQTRAYVNSKALNPFTINLLENYFLEFGNADLIDKYSKDFKDIFTIKIQDYLNIGYFTDTIIVEAYKAGYSINKIRLCLNEIIDSMFNIAEVKGSVLPIEVSFSHDGRAMVVQVSISIDSFDFEKDYYNRGNLRNKLENNSNFLDVTYLKSRNKLTLTNIWFKEESNFYGFFFTVIEKRKKVQVPQVNISLAEIDSEVKYKPTGISEKQDLSALALARKLAMFIKNIHKDDNDYFNSLNLDSVRSELTAYPIQSEIANLEDSICTTVIQILMNNSDDSINVIKGDKPETEASFIVKGSGSEKEEINLIKGQKEDLKEEFMTVKTLENSDELMNEDFEKKFKILEEKYQKSIDQLGKMKKIIDQFKAEMLKLKNAQMIPGKEELSQVSFEDSLARSLDESKINELKKITLELKLSEKSLLKSKADLESIGTAKDQKIALLEQRIENFKQEFVRTKEYTNHEKMKELETENKTLTAKLDLMAKGLTNATSNEANRESDVVLKKDKEIALVKSQLELAHTLIKKFKSEKENQELRHQIEMDTLRKKINPFDKAEANPTSSVSASILISNPITPLSKNNPQDNNLNEERISSMIIEKKVFEDKIKEQGLELKKAEHKLKLATAQLEEANKKKSKGEKGSANSNEAYIKQIEFANKKIAEVANELIEKKKEIQKMKQGNTQLGAKVADLERKLANLDKKAA